MKKELTYTKDGKEYKFLYEAKYDVSDYGESDWTDFYSTNTTKYKRKKYLFFGPFVEKVKYRKLFQIPFSIESASYTKNEVRKSLNRAIDIMNRKSELQRGEIV